MTSLSDLAAGMIVPALEITYQKAEPDVKELFLQDVMCAVITLEEWIDGKMEE